MIRSLPTHCWTVVDIYSCRDTGLTCPVHRQALCFPEQHLLARYFMLNRLVPQTICHFGADLEAPFAALQHLAVEQQTSSIYNRVPRR